LLPHDRISRHGRRKTRVSGLGPWIPREF
jgi:hypothetical protein